MAIKLYPPQIAGSLPAFYKTYNKTTGEATGIALRIPYTMNQGVGYPQIDGFCVRIKNVSSGTYVCPPQYSVNFNEDQGYVIFDIAKEYADIFEEGQYYKVQLAYYQLENTFIDVDGTVIVVDKNSPHAQKNIGYFSTAGIIKCVSYPSVYIEGYSLDSTNLFTGSFLGVYDMSNAMDKTEKVYSYSFSIYTNANDLYYTTGELIHNSVNDVEYEISTDSLIINDFISNSGKTFQIEYTVNTLNGLTVSSPRYRMTSEQLLAPNKTMRVIATPNSDEAYMQISFQGEKVADIFGVIDEDVYYGEYILTRASEEDNYTEWIEMHRFRLSDTKPSTISFKDFSIKQGVKYKYGVSQFNIWNITSSRMVSEEASVDFEDMFLFDGERQLKIRFNPKMSKFSTNVLEQKVETIGSKFPYIFRNGKVEYKEFPIEGLISYLMDDAKLFYNIKNDYIVNRKCTETNGIENEKGFFNHTDLSEENILRERQFKLEVLDWLNNGKPKIFKSATEGNYVVRLFKVTLKPENKLGRMLHSFSCTAYEIADFTYENLYKLGFVQKSNISKYVSLWKTYNFKDWPAGNDIVIDFDSNVSEFLIQDVLPGTKIQLFQKGIAAPIEIIIGATGSYKFIGTNQNILKIVIPVANNQKITGSLECQYSGVRYSDFDAITNIKLKTTVSQQFVGIEPGLANINETAEGGISDTILRSLNARILYNKYKDIYDKNGVLSVPKWKQIKEALKIGSSGTYKDRFLPGNVIQTIQSDIYNFKKPKVKILNVEQAHFRLRDLIPIYKVPYQYLPEESKIIVQLNGQQQVSDYQKQKNIEQYDALNGSLNFGTYFWSVTPFGQPYPIDKMTKIIQGDAVMNDPFCIFELFEYQDGQWVHFSGHNNVNVGGGESESFGGWYYDAYYGEQYSENAKGQALTDRYDPTFFIQDRFIYTPIEEENNKIINLLQMHSVLYVKDSDNQYIEYNKNQEQHTSNSYYYKDIKINNNGEIEETYVLIDGNIVNEYLNNKIYYDELFWVKQDNSYVQLKDTVIKNINTILCMEQLNRIDLRYANEMHFDNLGAIDIINIGNGVMLELTYQAQVIDYYTEENNTETAEAKKIYEDSVSFLENVFEDYENIANADEEWRKYEALYNIYYKLMNGTDATGLINNKSINSLIILALLNVDFVPFEILNDIYNNSNFEVKQQLEVLMNSNDQYDFESVLNIVINNIKDIHQQIIVKDIILRIYKDKLTYSWLQLMNQTEVAELNKALASDGVESIINKVNKLESIVNDINSKYNAILKEQSDINSTFITKKNMLNDSINTYNSAIRTWLMGLYLIESQLAKTPASLEDIKIYFSNQNNDIENNVASGKETISVGIAKAETIIPQIELILESIKISEEIKLDREDDPNLDNFVTEKEYSDINNMFVLLYFLKTIYETWEEYDSENTLKNMYQQTKLLINTSLSNYELFTNLSLLSEGLYDSNISVCNNLLEKIYAYYPEEYRGKLNEVSDTDISLLPKDLIEKYIIEVDSLNYIIDFYNEQNNQNTVKSHTATQEILLKKFLTVAEVLELNKKRLIVESIVEHSIKNSNFVQDDAYYFEFGIKEDSKHIERSTRIKELIKIINSINENLSIGDRNNSEKVIKYIYDKVLNENNTILNIVLVGHCKDGLNASVKDFNAFMNVARLDLKNTLNNICKDSGNLQNFYNSNPQMQDLYYDAQSFIEAFKEKAQLFFEEILIKNEFIKEIEKINFDRRLQKESEVKIPELKNFADFGKAIEYNFLLDEQFKTTGIFENIISPDSKTDILSSISSIMDLTLNISNNLSLPTNWTDAINKLYIGTEEEESNKKDELKQYEAQLRLNLINQFKVLYYYNENDNNKNFFEIYSIDEFIPMFMGYSFSNEMKSGLFYWYVRFSIGQTLEYYLQLLKQSSSILAEYSTKKENYMAKCSNYLTKYKNAYNIYNSFKDSPSWKYYSNATQDKQQQIQDAIKDMQDNWDTFILTLDKAFTEEVERGMYV